MVPCADEGSNPSSSTPYTIKAADSYQQLLLYFIPQAGLLMGIKQSCQKSALIVSAHGFGQLCP